MNKRLSAHDYLAGAYSIADMACIGWIIPHERQGQDLNDFPHLKRWYEAVKSRPAVIRGIDVGKDEAKRSNLADDKEAQKVLFGQRART
jgi:GSH-dependent disulfide-bond oxidoreductase